eukprot:1579226-Amphidinium_carterae.1
MSTSDDFGMARMERAKGPVIAKNHTLSSTGRGLRRVLHILTTALAPATKVSNGVTKVSAGISKQSWQSGQVHNQEVVASTVDNDDEPGRYRHPRGVEHSMRGPRPGLPWCCGRRKMHPNEAQP